MLPLPRLLTASDLKRYIAITPEPAKMPTAFPKVYEKLIREHESSFVRLYGEGYPVSKDIAQFEADLSDNMSHLRSFIASDVSEQLDLWGGSKLILRSAENKCPESTSSEGLPTVSHVYLELAHSFVLLKDGLFSDATKAAKSLEDRGSSSSKKILSLFNLNEGYLEKLSRHLIPA